MTEACTGSLVSPLRLYALSTCTHSFLILFWVFPGYLGEACYQNRTDSCWCTWWTVMPLGTNLEVMLALLQDEYHWSVRQDVSSTATEVVASHV